jgi:hypothetical protein
MAAPSVEERAWALATIERRSVILRFSGKYELVEGEQRKGMAETIRTRAATGTIDARLRGGNNGLWIGCGAEAAIGSGRWSCS